MGYCEFKLKKNELNTIKVKKKRKIMVYHCNL